MIGLALIASAVLALALGAVALLVIALGSVGAAWEWLRNA